jgi:hypothetical protein
VHDTRLGRMTDPADQDPDRETLPRHRLYRELASWWPLISPPEEYAEEAAFAASLLRTANPPTRTVLELGSGGGNNAFHLKNEFEMTLVDVSDEMLTVSRQLNPDCDHLRGDMRTLRLGRSFDAVFVHDAIDYMITAGRVASRCSYLTTSPRTSSRVPITAAMTRRMAAARATYHGPATRTRLIPAPGPITPSCFGKPTAPSTWCTIRTNSGSFRGPSGSGCSLMSGSAPARSQR